MEKMQNEECRIGGDLYIRLLLKGATYISLLLREGGRQTELAECRLTDE